MFKTWFVSKKKAAAYYAYSLLGRLRTMAFTHDSANALKLTDLEPALAPFDEIVVVASGPSALNIRRNNNAIYLTTNDSYKLVGDLPCLYFLADNFHLTKFIATRLSIVGMKAVVFRFDRREPTHVSPFRKAYRYVKANPSGMPTLLLSDYDQPLCDRTGFEFVNRTLKESTGMEFKQQNSGMAILLLGFCLALINGKRMAIYGLDAGEGGRRHFDGRGIVGEAVDRERIKTNLQRYLRSMYQNSSVAVRNYSNFYPN